ncbi:MAG TPA: metallophosphoesterase family protein [Polyangiaceae bacterium]
MPSPVPRSTAPFAPFAPARASLLVLSDVHLGSDIVEGSSLSAPARSKSVDEDLRAMLDHYRETRHGAEPWHLVINGDFIDFIGISIAAGVAGRAVSTEPSPEEHAHGLGTAEDHASIKLARVAERHGAVFESLAAFVGAGHRLTIVPGNHDREFHWDRIKDEFCAILLDAAPRSTLHSVLDSGEFLARIQFSPWFFWLEGVAYIEHGHQYDTFCATENVMTPLSPVDPRRLSAGFTEVLLRFVVHQTRGLGQHGHDKMGLVDYITLAIGLGVRGGIDLGTRYVRAIAELFRLRRSLFGDLAKALEREHDRRVALLGEATRIGMHRLRALAALQVPPVTRSIRGILSSLLVDELALACLSLGTLVSIGSLSAFTGHRGPFVWASAALVLVLWALGHRYLSRTRHVDPGRLLLDRAAPLGRLFPAAFVVMGHTHVPMRTAVGEGTTTYINTGSWAEDEGTKRDAPIAHRATRTHLVIRVGDAGPEAELLAWDSAEGPRRFAFG